MKISLLKVVGLTLLVCYSANALSDTSNAYAVPVGLIHAVADAKARGIALDLPYCIAYDKINECDQDSMSIGNEAKIDDIELSMDTEYAFKVTRVEGVLSGNVFYSVKSGEVRDGMDAFEISSDAVFVFGSTPKVKPFL